MTILSAGAAGAATIGRTSRSPSASASASLTPPAARSALVWAATWAIPARISRWTRPALGCGRGDRLDRAEQQRVVGDEQVDAELLGLVDHGGVDVHGEQHRTRPPLSDRRRSDRCRCPTARPATPDRHGRGRRAGRTASASNSLGRGRWCRVCHSPVGDNGGVSVADPTGPPTLTAALSCTSAWSARGTSADRRSARSSCVRRSRRPGSPTVYGSAARAPATGMSGSRPTRGRYGCSARPVIRPTTWPGRSPPTTWTTSTWCWPPTEATCASCVGLTAHPDASGCYAASIRTPTPTRFRTRTTAPTPGSTRSWR